LLSLFWAILFPGPCQLSEMVGITQSMSPAVIEIGLPVVMTKNALVVWQNPDLVKGNSTTLLVGIKITELVI